MSKDKVVDLGDRRVVKTYAESMRDEGEALIPATRADLRELGAEVGDELDRSKYDFTQFMIVHSALMQGLADWADRIQEILCRENMTDEEIENARNDIKLLNIKNMIYNKEVKIRSDIMKSELQAAVIASGKAKDGKEITDAVERDDENKARENGMLPENPF